MRRLFYITIVILFSGCSDMDNQEILETHSNGTPKTVKIYLNDENDKYIYKDFYKDGTLEFEGKVVNDKFVEYKKSYFSNGNFKETLELADSADLDYCCPDGFYHVYHENGQLKETHYKKKGVFNGPVYKYDTSGIKTGIYETSDDKKNGITKTFYQNGATKALKEYKNDTLIGTVYYFTEKGDSLKRHSLYRGKIDFPIKYWKDNGTSLFGEYNNDNKYQIKWTWRDSLNNITKEEIADTINGQFVTPNY
jgi:antitoxin component YwqK of YwqJK toxin-antitoxin module